MNVKDFQALMKSLFFKRDSSRGVMKTFAWFVEEVGELAHELRQFAERENEMRVNSSHENENNTQGLAIERKNLEDEFADVFAWLCSLANLTGVDLELASRAKYPGICSKCGNNPCTCKST
ncbi:MAG: MazG nucleotide pyrophosphohydrolase domain-containing protein [Promethearchaeota archaeon]